MPARPPISPPRQRQPRPLWNRRPQRSSDRTLSPICRRSPSRRTRPRARRKWSAPTTSSRRSIPRSSATFRASAAASARDTAATRTASSLGATRRATSPSGSRTVSTAPCAWTWQPKRARCSRRGRRRATFARPSRRDGPASPTTPRRPCRPNKFLKERPYNPTVPEHRAAAFARLFEAVHEGVYIGTIGPETSSTIAANPHLKLILGYPGEAPDADVRPFDRERFVDPQARVALLERLSTDGSVNDYLLRLRRADNSAVWVEVTARADPPATDESIRIEALVRDVSERKKLDDQTRDIFHQLLQAEKMAAHGQTISGVAHELNNPLATILSWAERLSQRTALEEPVRRGLETILSESERAARIVRNLLTFARKRQTTRAMVDVNQVARETLALRAYEQHVSNVTVIDALAAGLPNVFADGHQIQQVLLNLVINAEQAMLAAHGRGTLVVRTWHDADQESVVLEINDDGPGIPDDVQPKIFDPFFTTKEVGKGTGLGLTVAYAIVHEHGGRIRLETHPNAGASFYVELPVSGGKLAPAPVT